MIVVLGNDGDDADGWWELLVVRAVRALTLTSKTDTERLSSTRTTSALRGNGNITRAIQEQPY